MNMFQLKAREESLAFVIPDNINIVKNIYRLIPLSMI